MRLDGVEARLAEEVEEWLFATGGQLFVSLDGEVESDVAFGVDGAGAQVTTTSLFPIYCAGKPAFATAVLILVDEGELSLDDRLDDLVPGLANGEAGDSLVQDLLNHTSGLHRLTGLSYIAASERNRRRLLDQVAPDQGWVVGRDLAYCQIAPWEMLGWAVEELVQQPVSSFVRQRVLAPLGTGADLFVAGMTDEEYLLHRDRLAVNANVSGGTVVPMLAERNRRYRCMPSPAFGNTASARGLGRFYEGLLDESLGRGAVVPADLLGTATARTSHGFDPVMDRVCGYGLGFMVGLDQHMFGRTCSPRAFGHSGYCGMTFAFADPELGLVIACQFNGRIDADSAINFFRPTLVERIYRDLGLT